MSVEFVIYSRKQIEYRPVELTYKLANSDHTIVERLMKVFILLKQ